MGYEMRLGGNTMMEILASENHLKILTVTTLYSILAYSLSEF